MISYPWLLMLRWMRVPGTAETHLRALNAVALVVLWHTVRGIVQSVQDHLREQDGVASFEGKARISRNVASIDHVALNVALFPPLFFFSGLYYTDIVSTLLVLKAHAAFYRRQPFSVACWSLASLTLRQTNVFWTAIYLGALEVKRSLGRPQEFSSVANGNGSKEVDRVMSFGEVVKSSWAVGRVYDRRFELAALEGMVKPFSFCHLLIRLLDYLKTMISLAVSVLSQLTTVLLPLLLHILVLAAFGTFVLMNGGVVLGRWIVTAKFVA